MNAFLLIIPIFLIRYAFVSLRSKQKLQQLNYFPDTQGMEKYGKAAYILTNTLLLFAPLLLKFSIEKYINITGCIFYTIGLIMYIKSIHDFISANGLVMCGLYAYSRNPQPVSFILIYSGVAALTNSLLYMSLTVILTWSFHEMAKSEERYCRQVYGEQYELYKRTAGRFF